MTQATSTPQRKLAAIMFTDIAGYTAAMSADEETALKTLRKKRSILKPLITDNNGTFVKEIGDGTLSYFHSAIDAATCAVSLQQATYDDADMNLRIGVHVGDIVFDDEDVFGDGVNVAARLESMAPVGGVCVSKSVFEELLNKKEFDGIPLGLQQLKGVGRLIDVFALKAKNLIHPDPKEYEEHKVEPHSGDEVPSVAVLPLKNKGKEEDAFYAYGITADLISDLSRAGRIRVVSMDDIATADVINLSSKEAAKKLHVRYIVNGMLWKHEDMFQLSIEMDDTTNNTVIWSDRWQEHWGELTTIKSKLSDSLLNALNLGTHGEIDTIQTNTEAYEYYLKGRYWSRNRKDHEQLDVARGFLSKAIELDPGLLEAKIALGNTFAETGNYDKAISILKEILSVANDNQNLALIAYVYQAKGRLCAVKGQDNEALKAYKQALNLSREICDRHGEVENLNLIANNYCEIGELVKSMEYVNQSICIAKELGDRRREANAIELLGRIHHHRENYKKALILYRESMNVRPEAHNRWNQAMFHHINGEAYFFLNMFQEAISHFNSGKELWIQLENPIMQMWNLSWCMLVEQKLGNHSTAKKQIKEIESFIANDRLYGEDRIIVCWNLSQVYDEIGNMKKSISWLETAYKELQGQAAEIKDNARKASYLQNIRENRDVISAWESFQN